MWHIAERRSLSPVEEGNFFPYGGLFQRKHPPAYQARFLGRRAAARHASAMDHVTEFRVISLGNSSPSHYISILPVLQELGSKVSKQVPIESDEMIRTLNAERIKRRAVRRHNPRKPPVQSCDPRNVGELCRIYVLTRRGRIYI